MAVNACATAARLGPASQEEPWPAYLGSPARISPRVDSVAADPQPVWRVVVGRGVIGAPALGEDVVAVSQAEAQVALLERATGDVIWRRRLGATASSGPLLVDDRLFVATQTSAGTVYALRLSDGRELWSESIGDAGAPPAYAAGAVYASTTSGWVVALDADRATCAGGSGCRVRCGAPRSRSPAASWSSRRAIRCTCSTGRTARSGCGAA